MIRVIRMKSLATNRMRVLGILRDNLRNSQPQQVNIEKFSTELQLSLKETRDLLLLMDQDGDIQSDIDVNYSIITPAGLHKISVN